MLPSLTVWANFYVIMGAAAGSLTGLMFVVVTLVAGERDRLENVNSVGVGAYSSPTVVHFAIVLLLAALLSAPWRALTPAAIALGLTGVCGLIYALFVTRRLIRAVRANHEYAPVLEDWLCYAALPLIAYAALVVAAFLLPQAPTTTLFAVGAAMVMLLCDGIHNAWDIVTFLIFTRPQLGAANNRAATTDSERGDAPARERVPARDGETAREGV